MMMLGALDWLAAARHRLAALADDAVHAPADALTLAGQIGAKLQSGEGVRAFAYLLVLLVTGVGAEWLYRTYAGPALAGLEASAPATARDKLRLGLRRLALRLCGLALFGATIVATSASFAWPPGMQETALILVTGVVLARLALQLADFLLCRNVPRLRLLPVPDRAARKAFRLVAAIVAIGIAGWLPPDLIEHFDATSHLPGAIRLAAAVLLALLSLAALRGRRPTRRRLLPAFPLSFLAIAAVFAILALWLLGAWQAAATVLVVFAVAGVEIILRDLIKVFSAEEESGASIVTAIILRFGRLLAVLAGLVVCAVAWDLPVFQMHADESMAGRFTGRALGVVALLLAMDVVWLAARTAIDARLRKIGPAPAEGENNPNGRLVTLLPLVRMALGIVLATLTVLSAMSIMGIEITPLLAGAGVLGIAVGFGAQTLVRDMIAGMFFLIEDVFRVGEYIESGASVKGTVERITLRSVALRHQDGPIYFVPYGALGAVRNNSRDYAVDKFTFPLSSDVDSEMIRKMIKKVGEKMMDDPELAPMIITPLKGRLYRIDPGVKIFRCKFQTAPGNQTEVRSKAYKGIEAALKAAGLAYAGNAQMVIMEPGARTSGSAGANTA